MCVHVCVCMCVCARLSNVQTTIIHKRLEISSWNLVQQWSSHAPSFVTIFIQVDVDFLIFFIVISNLKTSMYPWSFLREEAKIKQHTFSKKELCETGEEAIWESRFTCFCFLTGRFWIFWEFSQSCLTQTNFDLSSWNVVRKCTNTKWYLIPNFVRIGRDP